MSQVKGISISNSGMDIDSLVKNSVSKYQSNYDAAYKKKVVAEWTKTAYADLYSSISTFRNGTAYDFHLAGSTTAHTVKSGDDSVVTASANGDAVNMSHDVIVGALAENANLQSTGKITRKIDTPTSVKLADVAGIAIDDTNSNSDKIALSFDVQDSADSTKSHTVSYTYKDLKEATLNDFASDIRKLGLNITASYDATNDNMSIYNKKLGTSNIVKITANAASASTSYSVTAESNVFLTHLNLGSYSTGTGTVTPVDTTALANGIAGKNSSITVDGHTFSSESNTVTTNNVTYTAIKPSATTTKVAVATDVDALVKSVQKFVDSYNEILDKLNTQLHASKYSAYGALTKDEEENMSDKQLENWEAKAKSGLLRNDPTISSIVNDMRSAVSQKVEGLTGDYKTLASIGVEVGKGSNSYKEYGKLHLDETKLRKAIGADPDIVQKMFTANNTSTSTTDTSTQGVGTRLYNITRKGLSNIEEQAGTSASSDNSYYGKKIANMDTNLKALLKALQAKETYYYTKYNKMESAIGNLNSSITSLTSMLG